MQAFNPSTHTSAVQIARQKIAELPVYLDTETTGLDRQSEIVEISIVDQDGLLLFNSLVRPSQLIPAETTAIHGITDEMVQQAPTWPAIWPTVRGFLFGRLIAIYNVDFDLRMMQQSHGRYRLQWHERFNTVDVMKIYAEYRGEWDSIRRSMRFFRLAEAGRYFNIQIPNAHRATADALLARAVLHAIASVDIR